MRSVPLLLARETSPDKNPNVTISRSGNYTIICSFKAALALPFASDHSAIYTDASKLPDSEGVGVGLAVTNRQQTIYTEKLNIGSSQIVYNGELEGVTRAIEYTSKIAQSGYKFRIFSDNQAGLYRLRKPSDKPGQSNQIRSIVAAKATVAKGANIKLYWSPGHTDIYGNELADFLAKRATKLAPSI